MSAKHKLLKTNPHGSRRAIVETLEPRLLLSAGLEAFVINNDSVQGEALLQPATEAELIPQSDSNQTHVESIQRQELVFVDTDTPDYQLLLDDLLNNQTDDRQIEVVLLDNEQSGIDQISETLASRGDLDAIHIISHGADGTIDLGNTQLEFDSLLQNSKQIANWGQALSADGDLLLYGCDLAASSEGQSLVNALAKLTGADVAASDDLTGSTQMGGDWELEYQAGQIETVVAFSSQFKQQWNNVLAAPTADAGGSYAINEGDAVVLDASASNDTDGDPLTYSWDIDNDGTYGDVTGVSASLTWAQLQSFGINDDGLYNIGVLVDDGTGNTDTAAATIDVANTAPTLTTTGLATAGAGQTYTLNLDATDPGNDTITYWTINWGDGNIDTLAGDPSSATHTYSTAGFTYNITAAATDEDGTHLQNDLLVASSGNPEGLIRYNTDGTFVTYDTSDIGTYPVSAVVGPDGNIYVSDWDTGQVIRYDGTTGASLGVFVDGNASGEGMTSSAGVAFGPDGNLYVASHNTDQVLRYDGTTGAFIDVYVDAGTINGPEGLVFGPDGTLYIGGYNDDTIYQYDGTTLSVLSNDGDLIAPEDMVFGPDGALYVANDDGSNVLRVDVATGNATIFAQPGGGANDLQNAIGLRFGPDGNLYVSSWGSDSILRYDGTTGAFIDKFISTGLGGLDQPDYIEFFPGHQVTVSSITAVNDSYSVNEDQTLVVNALTESATATDLLAAWQLDENSGTTAIDSTGNGIDGTISGATWTTSGRTDAALQFDGVDDYVDLGSDASIDNIFAGGGTISVWINPADWGENNFGRILDKSTTVFADNGWGLQLNGGTNAIRLEHGFSTTRGVWEAQNSISLNTWNHIVITYDNSSTANDPLIYVNGELQTLFEESTPVGTASSDATQNLVMGNFSGGTSRTFDGLIDAVGIYNRTLTATEIVELYQTGVIANDADPDGDILTASVVTGPANGTLSLNTNGSFTYTPDADFNGTDSFIYEVSDGSDVAQATVTITVNPVNDAPEIDLDTNDSSATGLDFITNFFDGDAPVNITDTDVSLIDVDDSLNSITVTLTNQQDGTNKEILAASDPGGTGLAINWNQSTSTLTISGSGTVADYLSVLSTVTYVNTQNNPNTIDRNITFVVDDGITTSLVATTTVRVFQGSPGNDVPVAQPNTVTTLEDNAYAFSATDFTYVDIEGDALVSATITNQQLAGGTLTYNGGTAVIDGDTLTAAELDTLIYTPAADAYGAPLATFDFAVNDADPGTVFAQMDIDVTPVNDVPVNTVPGAQVVDEDTPLNISGISVSDIDGDVNTVELSVSNGTLSVTLAGGAGISAGANASDSLTLSGTQADINTTLASLIYQGNTDFNGADTLTIVTTDTNAASDTDTVAITVNAVNDPPVANNDSYSVNENETLVVNAMTDNATAANLLAAWQFDEGTGTTVTDATGNGNDGTINGATWTTSSRTGDAALVFDPSNGGDYIQTTADLSTAMNFTLSAWFKVDTTAGQQHILWQGVSTQNGWGEPTIDSPLSSEMNLTIGHWDAAINDKITFFLGYHDLTIPDSINIISSSDFTDTTTWHQAVVVVEETGTPGELQASLYIDGVFEGSDTGTQIDRSQWDSNLRIGRAGPNQRYFDGSIDEVGIYDSALTAAEISALYATGILANDTDAEGDTLTVNTTPITDVSNGTLALNTDGSFTYTPNAGWSGTDSFTYEVSDGNGGTDTATVNITVNPINSAPTDLAVDNLTVAENVAGAVIGNVSVTDPDAGDTHTYSVDDARFEVVGGQLKLVAGQSLDFETEPSVDVTITATDAGGLSYNELFTITVTNTNDAPSVVAVNLGSINEDGSITITQADLLAGSSDVDGDPLSAINLTLNTGSGTLTDLGGGNWSFSPTANWNGAVSFDFEVSDGTTTTANTASLTVMAVNDAPTAADTSINATEDTVYSGTLPVASDVEGDAITYALGAAATNGTAVVNADGSFSYTPNANYNGGDSFIYTVSDAGGSNTYTVTVNVAPVNDAPVANNDSYSTNEDTVLTAVLGVDDVLQNDSDVEGDSLAVNITPVTDVNNGTLTLNADGTFTYTPDANFNGTDSFTYEVSDGNGGTAQATVTITVNAINDAPVAADTTINATEDTVYSGNLPAASDVDGDPVTYSLGTAASNGTAVVNADGSFSYTPNINYNGADSFSYTVSDGNGGSNTYTVTVNVAPVNDAPVANNDAFTVNEGSTTNLDLAFNDIDVDDGLDLSSITIVSSPTNGSITVNADGTVDYTHDGSETLTDSFIYTIDDLTGTTSNTGFVSLTITPVNDAPVASNDNLSTLQGTALTITTATNLLGNDTDVEGDPLSITGFTQPANGTVVNNADGTLTYTPNSTFIGVDSFTYTVDDGNGGTDTATLNVTVNAIPGATDNTSSETQSSNDMLISMAASSTSNDSPPVQETVKQHKQQQVYETTTARDVSALLSVLNPVHIMSQVDVIDEGGDIYRTDRFTNNEAQPGLSNSLANLEQLWQELDQLRSTINDSNDGDGIFKGSFSDVVISLGGLSVTSGLIAWLFRGGSLAASFISAMPLWKGMDPLPVLIKNKKDDEDDDDDATNISADKRVERLIQGDSSHW